MRKIVNYTALVSFVFTTACAGHNPNPVMVSQYGDESKSCQALEMEMSNAQGEMQRLVGDTNKTGQNVALGVTGLFLIVPWFFMDFKEGEKVEYDAWRQRYMHLGILASNKNCGIKEVQIPTSDQLVDEAKKAKDKKDQ